jgi:dihydrofolate synthase / folylpolyglutamate synthase
VSSPDPRLATSGAARPTTYAQALEAIETRGRYGIHLGLARVRALLRAMGNPERSVRGALVAGTNGKGSVIALAGSALRAAGYRVGETPKPHLVTYRERIVVDGRPIAAADFVRLVGDATDATDRVARRLGPATEFELLTAVMFRHFADAGLDVALVEVGLGGRLDATNAWDGGVAVLTNVGLDHTDRLGPTIAAIAREKVQIVKRGDLAVTGAEGEALAILRRRCARMGVPLAVAPSPPILGMSRDVLTVDLPRLGPVAVGLRGRHQAANVAVADGLLDALERAGNATVPAEARRRGYAAARWPGRLELITWNPGDDAARGQGLSSATHPGSAAHPRSAADPGSAAHPSSAADPGSAAHPRSAADPSSLAREVLLDGAHNPDGAAALAVALDDLRPFLAGGDEHPPATLTLVWASMADKDVQGVIAAAGRARALAGATVICTSMGLPRALPAADLAAAWRAGLPGADVRIEPDPDAALDLALRTGRGPVVVAGSLYLVGATRARLVDDPALRDPDPA